MKLTIELDREVDGRWIAEVPELNVLLYVEAGRDSASSSRRPENLIGSDCPRRSASRIGERHV